MTRAPQKQPAAKRTVRKADAAERIADRFCPRGAVSTHRHLMQRIRRAIAQAEKRRDKAWGAVVYERVGRATALSISGALADRGIYKNHKGTP